MYISQNKIESKFVENLLKKNTLINTSLCNIIILNLKLEFTYVKVIDKNLRENLEPNGNQRQK